jgi:hypothetical protein
LNRELKKESRILKCLENLDNPKYQKNYIVDIEKLKKVATAHGKHKEYERIVRKNGVSFGKVVIY